MKNLILLCIGLLTGRQRVELTETPPTNNTTTLRQNFNQSSPEPDDTDTRHVGSTRNASSGSDVTHQTRSEHFSSITSGYDTTEETPIGNSTTTISEYDRTEATYPGNEEFIYTTLSGTTLHPSTERKSTDLHRNSSFSYTTSRLHESHDEGCMCIMWYTIWSIIGLVGIIANVCLCMVFVLRKEMRTFPNLMIINLTISDIFCILINIPIFIIDDTSSSWQFSEFVCQFYYWTRFLTIGSSVYSVAVISLQRFFALMIFKSNASHCLLVGKYKTFLVLIFVWTLAGALSLRYSLNLHVENFKCYSVNDDVTLAKRNNMVDFILYCVIPLTIIGSATAATSIRLKKSVRNMPGEVCVPNNARRDRVVSANVLLAFTIVFALSYVPYFSYYVYLAWYEIPVAVNIDYGIYGLLFANSCFNPIALFIMSRKYRRILVNDIICRKKSANGSTDNSDNSTITVQTRL